LDILAQESRPDTDRHQQCTILNNFETNLFSPDDILGYI